MEKRCARCQRPNPEASDDLVPVDWEVLGEDGGEVVCPYCVTGAEQQAMDMDWMDTEEALSACSRCGKPRPTTPPEDAIEDHGWYLVEEGFLVCLACLTPAEIDAEAQAVRTCRDQKLIGD